jgi:hypothetical protein
VGKTVETAKPMGYYWRRGPGQGGAAGIGGLYDVLGPTGWSVEDGSYVKLRELSVSYRIGPVGGVGNWDIGVVGRNLHTWSKFRGWDPETGITGGSSSTNPQHNALNSAALNAVAGYLFPNLRTFTLKLSTNF